MADERPGLYGRTNKGRIIRFAWLQDENGQTMERCVVKFVKGGLIKYWLDKDESIAKYSKNIIDLIRVGDYVNSYLVVAKSDDGYIEIAIGDDIEQGELLEDEDIKSIVTKEQYKQIEYIVEE